MKALYPVSIIGIMVAALITGLYLGDAKRGALAGFLMGVLWGIIDITFFTDLESLAKNITYCSQYLIIFKNILGPVIKEFILIRNSFYFGLVGLTAGALGGIFRQRE